MTSVNFVVTVTRSMVSIEAENCLQSCEAQKKLYTARNLESQGAAGYQRGYQSIVYLYIKRFAFCVRCWHRTLFPMAGSRHEIKRVYACF